MRIRVLAVGTRMPGWVTEGTREYSKRLPRQFRLEWVEVAAASRQGLSPAKCRELEAVAIRKKLAAHDRVIALDVAGRTVSTEDIAAAVSPDGGDTADLAILIGGPDGLDEKLLRDAHECWSLGRVTLPHPLVRVVLAEQLYRAWSINAGHPYHRA